MTNKYIDLINQTFDFPQEGFEVVNSELLFSGVPLMDLAREYGTPLRITYLPAISKKIQMAKKLFHTAMEKHNYQGKYFYSYCTKASHFSFVLNEALKNDIHIETSSAFDVDLVRHLTADGKVTKDTFVIANGFKPDHYKEKLAALINDGYRNVIPVLDNKEELDYYDANVDEGDVCKVGIRIAADEQPNFEFYTSRLGVRYNDIVDFYKQRIADNPKFQLKMLHFFINTGIKDNIYYWNELHKAIRVYYELKKICPELEFFNIGGGLPIQNSLGFKYDFEYMIEEIVSQLKHVCTENGVPEPSIFTEFGSFTVGESGVMIFKVLTEKLQNDKETWYMIDGSLMTTLPDIWGINQRFIMLPINKWNKEYQRVNIGGLSCDIYDYYNSEAHISQVFLPNRSNGEPLYLGFFHVGAYQESLSGFGGTKHCMIPSPRFLLVDRDEEGKLTTKLFAEEQKSEAMLSILGY